jgi:phospholipase C
MPPGLDALKHIVVLMMENRSFDHMLGDLQNVDPRINGLDGTQSNPDANGAPVPMQATNVYQSQLQPDPGHHFEDVRLQIFGVDNDTGAPNMQGFVKSYFSHRQDVANSHNVMTFYKKEKVPVLSTLAQKYAVFNNWYSSLPGPTLPNRAFVHFGTSFGKVEMTLFFFGPIKSIYERVTDAGGTAKIFFFNDNSASLGMTNIFKNQPKIFGLLDDFFDGCKSGKLPQYSFLEPNYNDQDDDDGAHIANDQHPDHNVLAGEKLIFDVYHALRSNQQLWESTLLLIVYDEHGGIYDHVIPPGNYNGTQIGPPVAADDFTDESVGFKFDRLGIRVPAVAVSPWIEPNTVVDKMFDHTSIPATVTEKFISNPDAARRSNREKNANTFLDLLTRATPRPDPPMNFHMSNQPTFGARDPNTLFANAIPESANQPDRLIHGMLQDHVKEMYEAEKELPAEEQTGTNIADIKTEKQAGDYIKAVMQRIRKHAESASAQGAQ